MDVVESLARMVDGAAATAKPIRQLTASNPNLDVELAYAIQSESLNLRYRRGERRVGIKMGLTSRAKMQQVGVDEVVWGRLTDAMLIEEGGSFSRGKYIHPRLEPEIAFVMKRRLVGQVTPTEAFSAIDAIAPAIELIDSRYENFKFALVDVIADNSSSSGFIVGGLSTPDVDFSNLGMVMHVNGRPVQIGSSAAILGHPLRSLVAAARLVERCGEAIEPGDIVLAGGATAAHTTSVGECVHLEVERLGSVVVTVGE